MNYPNYKKTIFPYINQDGSTTWVVEFPDLPGCNAVGPTEKDALEESKTALRLWLDEYYAEKGCYPDATQVQNSYSGKILIRIPKSLHQELVQLASAESVSLNTLIVSLLARNSVNKSLEKNIIQFPTSQIK